MQRIIYSSARIHPVEWGKTFWDLYVEGWLWFWRAATVSGSFKNFFQLEKLRLLEKHDKCQEFSRERYSEEQEMGDAIHTVLLTLKEGFEGEMNEKASK